MSEFDAPNEYQEWDGGDTASDDGGADLFAGFDLPEVGLPDLPDLELPDLDLDLDLADLDVSDLSDVDDLADHGAGLLESLDVPEVFENLLDGVDLSFDVIGADPDEDGLWSDLMLDLNDDINPYVTN